MMTSDKPNIIYTKDPWSIFESISGDGVCLLRALEYTGISWIHFLIFEKEKVK